ncbi:MAG: AraC family transcriptional regulator [Kofleriaceae bacterium]
MPVPPRGDFQEPTAPLRLVAGADRFALAGQLDQIGEHRHAAPVIVVGLDRPLVVTGAGARRHASRAAVIAPGFAHAVDVAGGRIAVFVLAPSSRSREGMVAVRDLGRPADWVELGRAVLDGELHDFAVVDRAIARAAPNARPVDDRLRRVIAALRARLDDNLPIEAIAGEVGLSPTRVMALARAEVGAPLRYVRRWLRTFSVARDYAAGATLTTAALDAGFASSAHLSVAAREHFGIRPSQILSPRNRAAIIAC